MASRAKAAAKRKRGKVSFTKGTSTKSIERAGRLKRGFPLKDPETGEVSVKKMAPLGMKFRDVGAKPKPKKKVDRKARSAADAARIRERLAVEKKMGVKRGRGAK
jgi:hypothetical protein